MNYLESLHAASARLIEMEKAYYTTFPDQPELEPKHIDIYAKVIRELCPEPICSVPLELTITTDSAGCHMIFRLAPDHVACISTVENSVGLYDSNRTSSDAYKRLIGLHDDKLFHAGIGNTDSIEAALEHDPIYMGHLGEDWN